MLENFPVYMSSFHQERIIRVFLPESYYEDNLSYPVLYMHDGQNVFQDEDATRGISLGMKDYLEESGLKIIVVAIDFNPEGEERVNEYCPWVNGAIGNQILGQVSSSGGRGEEYLQFITDELKPLIDEKYRTLVNHTAMAGISLGGLISTYAACRYPNVFKRIAALSTGFYRNQEEIEQLLSTADLSTIERFYMDFGTTEVGADEEMNQVFLDLTNRVYKILNSKTTNLHYKLIEGAEHAYPYFRKRIPNMLTYLYSDLVNNE
jgi:predicted alpha/beta superfamily hydrolase